MNTLDHTSLPPPHYHDGSGAVRFWVSSEGGFIGASISKATLHYGFHAEVNAANALTTYMAHRVAIDAAVRRRIDQGSIEPVMLREADLKPA
jgi:hypothetical protein